MHLESSVVLDDKVANVFKKITDIKNVNWRSDLNVIKGIDDNNFIEYSKKGYPTFYTVLKSTRNKSYELEFTNNKVEGYIKYFLKKEEDKTNIIVTLDITFVNAKFKMIAKHKLKKEWNKFISDLSKK